MAIGDLAPLSDDPPSIPDHVLSHRIGAGSYGEVWIARNAVGTRRAVKIVRLASFKNGRPYEREFSGMLKFEPVSRSHEGLMDILQIGRNDEEGYFYYVMELADDVAMSGASGLAPAESGPEPVTSVPPSGGYRPLTLGVAQAVQGRLPLADCLGYFITLASALAALHRAGLIHRDIKPSNIIIVGGVAKLADIGLVADVDGTRSFVGTEGFIPPEGPGTAQADIYSLGKVLYEVATGKDRKEYPSLPLGDDAKNPPRDLLELNAIISRACATEVKERYASAAEMQADLVLLQSGRSVRGLHAFESRLRAAKRAGFVAAAVAVAALGALALTSWKARVEGESRARTEAALVRAAAAEQDAKEKLYGSSTATAVAELRSDLVGRRFRALDAIKLAAAIHPHALELRHVAISALALPDLRETSRIVSPEWGTGQGFSRDLGTRFIGSADGMLHARRLADDKELFTLPGKASSAALITPHPRDDRWLLAVKNYDIVELWDLAGRSLDRSARELREFCVSPDGRRTVSLSVADGLIARDLVSGVMHAIYHEGAPTDLVEFLDDDLLAVASNSSSRIRLVEWATGRTRHSFLTMNGEPPTSMKPSPDGGLLALCFNSGLVAFYPARDPRTPRSVVAPHERQVGRLAFHPDGDWCLTTSWDGTTRLIGTSEGQVVSLLRGGNAHHTFSPDGKRVGSCEGVGKDLVLYECVGREVCRVLGETIPDDRNAIGTWNGGFSPDGRLLASATYDGIRIYETRFGREVAHLADHLWYAVVFSGETGLFAAGPSGMARWPVARQGPDRLAVGPREDLARDHQWYLQAAKGGGLVVSIDAPRRFVLRSADGTWRKIHHGSDMRGVCMSPDGRRVSGATPTDLSVGVWDTATGKVLRRFPTRSPGSAAFSPDGARLVINEAEDVVVWDLETGEELWRRPLPRSGASVAWSPDGRTVAAVRENMVPVLLDAATGNVLARLEHPDARPCSALAFSPDSSQLACFLGSHRIHLWDLRALRHGLGVLGLDWDQPSFPEALVRPIPTVELTLPVKP